MGKKYVRFHEKGQGRALIELARQYPPNHAIREFVTNSIDARVPDTLEDIIVTVNPYERRVVISDNGVGMIYDKLVELSTSIGYSEKAGDIDMRGEKALGLLAFGSLGDVMQIISRPHGDNSYEYGYLRWEIDESKWRITYDNREISAEEVEKYHLGNFPHGTRVIIDRVNPHIMDKVLTVPNLKNWLRMLYNPALRKEISNIHLGRLDKRSKELRTESLEAIEYARESSSELLDDIVSIHIKNEEVPGDLEILLYVDPEAVYDKVAVYSKDVLVYESLAELPEFSKSPVWTSGKVSGYFNDYFNKLILGRAGIDRIRNAFKAWYSALQEIEEKIRPIVEEKKKHGRRVKEDNYIRRAFAVLADIWKDIKKTEEEEEYTKSESGVLTPVEGTEPTKERGGERKPPKPKTPGVRPPGPGTFRHSPDGHLRRVVPRRAVPFGYPQPIEFPADESHLRSKLEDLLGVSPTLFLNSAHEDYISRVNLRDSNIFIRYILELMAKEAAYYDARKAEREGRLIGDKDEIVHIALQKEEYIKFLGLKRLGIK